MRYKTVKVRSVSVGGGFLLLDNWLIRIDTIDSMYKDGYGAWAVDLHLMVIGASSYYLSFEEDESWDYMIDCLMAKEA
jgi:hypothetical protein